MRGRKPKPRALKILQGNPGKRPTNQPEPDYGEIGPPPADLDAGAKKEWKRVVLKLGPGVLTEGDWSSLVVYCSAFSEYNRARVQVVKTGGPVISAPNGFPMTNPWCKIRDKALSQFNRLAPEFGFTPVSRQRVKVVPKKQESALDKMMG